MNFILALALVTSTILVGPNRAQKQLQPIKDGNEYVLDYGTYEFGKNISAKNLIIRSANPEARATIHFPSNWGKLPNSGPDLGSPIGHSINCLGKCVLKDVKTSGGEGVVLFNTQPGANLLVQHVDMDGGGVLRGSGSKSVQIVNVQSSGKPTAYFIANFTNPASEVLVDLSANTLPVQQGGHCRNGKPTCDNTQAGGEAAIRFMQTDHLVMKGVVGKAWLFDGKHDWKQFLQLRDSGKMEIFKSNLPIVDVGDMAWRKPAKETKEVDFTDCEIAQVHKVDGWKKIVYKNTKVAGKLLNTTEVK